VVCPWHGSVFDVRTGRVVDGPAERDLRTYRVEVKGDEVIVYE
jgi:Ferredoxin subunits of nitrite reductase and ring-hydroxylating dioxygenases